MLKLFCLKVSKHWEFCGGAAVVIAESVEEVQRLLTQREADIHLEHFGTPDASPSTIVVLEEEEDRHGDNTDTWVVAEVFPCSEATPRVVVFDYNYA